MTLGPNAAVPALVIVDSVITTLLCGRNAFFSFCDFFFWSIPKFRVILHHNGYSLQDFRNQWFYVTRHISRTAHLRRHRSSGRHSSCQTSDTIPCV